MGFNAMNIALDDAPAADVDASKAQIAVAMENKEPGASDFELDGDGSGTGVVATGGDVGGDLTMENAQVDPFAKWYTFIAEYDLICIFPSSLIFVPNASAP